MAFLTVFIRFISRELSSVIQAIFGRSVTALFGELPPERPLAVRGALGLSIAWRVFVLGLFFPTEAGWMLSIPRLESWCGAQPLRVAWAVRRSTRPRARS